MNDNTSTYYCPNCEAPKNGPPPDPPYVIIHCDECGNTYRNTVDNKFTYGEECECDE